METSTDNARSKLKILLSPWTVLVSIAIGVFIGVQFPSAAENIAPVGTMYLSFLQMCVIPILITAVVGSLGELINTHHASESIRRMTIVFLLGLLMVSSIGVVSGLLGNPGGELDEEAQATLGNIINESEFSPDLEISLSGGEEVEKEPGVFEFLLRLVPSNVFESLSDADTLQLVFFSLVLGIAVGLIPRESSELFLRFVSSVFKAFQRIIDLAMYALPVGLTCLLADQISRVGVDILFAMTKFVVLFYVLGSVILAVGFVVIWRRSRADLGYSVIAQREPILVALGTRSSLASIPSAIHSLSDRLRFDHSEVNLFVPLGVTICRYGNVAYFALAAFFVAQLYETSLGGMDVLVILIGSILAGMATAGATGILTLSMMTIVLDPLGLPWGAAIVLFIAIDPIVDPLRTLLIVQTNMAATSVIAPRPEPEQTSY